MPAMMLRRKSKIRLDGCCDLADAGLVDARALDSEKYMDEVFTGGHGKLYQSDGRHRVNPTEGYGTGGLLQGKKHMLSLTWNAPIEAFTREGDFFEGKGVDVLYMHFHKANEFIGLSRLPTFLCNDVVKNPQVEKYLADYQAHLEKVFG
ncbi:modulator of drug activity [Neisseria gonorrhoeae]|uniref:Modulator of drug activity n=1 Tax=Neisseria gonorrhoeae TaxID=485 RepID=A0A378VVI6_NEIGO|nr:modulator of drug activity [Neisseria gonorrhoeae]